MSVYDDIKSKIQISSVAREYLVLKKVAEGRYIALCPFHGEKTPSFQVDDNRQSFRCYGCSLQGDVVDFVEKIESISHQEAVKRLKVEAGIEDEFMTPSQKRSVEAEKKKRMQALGRCRQWKSSLIRELVLYTNAQWKIYRTASRQFLSTQTEELEKQMEDSFNEAVSRESAIDDLEAMSETDLMEWHGTMNTWSGVKNPRWVLGGWRRKMVAGG